MGRSCKYKYRLYEMLKSSNNRTFLHVSLLKQLLLGLSIEGFSLFLGATIFDNNFWIQLIHEDKCKNKLCVLRYNKTCTIILF